MNKKSSLQHVLNHPYYLIFVISLFIAAFFYVLITIFSSPYQLKLTETRISQFKYHQFHDFDHDFISEIFYYLENKKKYVLGIRLLDGRYLDEFPFRNRVIRYFFNDIDRDGWDEILVFSKTNDSLYLSIISVRNLQWIVREQFFKRRIQKQYYHYWDIESRIKAIFHDLDRDGTNEIIISVSSGYSLFPRGIYIYDFVLQKIIHSFESSIRWNNILINDINKDGNLEIIAVSQASGNISFKTQYSDSKGWLFIFDANLSLLKAPRALCDYPGGVEAYEFNKESPLIIILAYNYNKSNSSYRLYQLLPNLTIKKIADYPGTYSGGYFYMINDSGNLIFNDQINQQTILINHDLVFTKIKKKSIKNTQFITSFLPGMDTKPLLVGLRPDKLIIIDQKFDMVAHFNITIKKPIISLFYQGSSYPIGIGIKNDDNFYLLSFSTNLFYKYRLFISSIMGILIFLLLNNLYPKLIYLKARNGLYKANLQSQTICFALFDVQGRTILEHPHFQTFSQQITSQLKLNHFSEIIKSDLSSEDFQKIAAVKILQNKPFEKLFKLSNYSAEYFINISEIRFFKILKLGWIIFFSIKEKSFHNHNQRWYETIQKLAHNIKTPISTLILNLKTMELQLKNSNFANQKSLIEKIRLMSTELEKIKNSSEVFTRFMGMFHVQPEMYKINDLIEKLEFRFKAYTNTGRKLIFHHDEEVNEYVYADPFLIFEALQICIENAFQLPQPQVIVEVTFRRINPIENPEKIYTEIEISDNGPGIPENILSKIWEPFFTTKENGNGLGLTFLKKFVDEHMGKIEVYTTERIGTTFKIWLPYPHEEYIQVSFNK